MDEVSGFRLVLFGTMVVFAAWASWWAKIKALTIPRSSIVYQGFMVTGMVAAVWGVARGAGAWGGILAFCAVLAGGMFLFTAYISGLPLVPTGAGVGDAFLDFTAQDSDGQPFTLSTLGGQPFLLKFYRGHW